MRDLEKDAMYTAIQQHGKFSYRYYKEPEQGKKSTSGLHGVLFLFARKADRFDKNIQNGRLNIWQQKLRQ